jgi:predicted amidophosphoribosyltransferase
LDNAVDECKNPICGWENRTFGRIFSICPKTGSVDNILQHFKFAARPLGWSVIFGRLVLGWLEENIDPEDYDAIIANPTDPTRPVRHTELILEAAAKEDLEDIWPIYPDALVKTKATNRSGQSGAGWRAKWDAAQELDGTVEAAEWIDLTDKRVLVFDDIATTCAQFQVLGGMLRRWGASNVDGLVIARTGG